jgi:hypothetical protein
MKTRVIQWATGPVGAAALRETISSPDLELVGLWVHGADKIGKDAGEIAGLPPTGVIATNDKASLIDLEADVVLHAAANSFGVEESIEDIIALLHSGKTVISTTSFVHLPSLGAAVEERFERACLEGGARFFAAGMHPGFMFERLAVTLTSLSQRIDRIVVQEFVDCSHMTQVDMLTHMMGMGKRSEEITSASPVFQLLSNQFEQCLLATAEALDLRVDEIRTDIKTALADEDLVLACTTLRAGTVAGQLLTWTAYCDGRPVLVAEEYWTCTDIPEWNTPIRGRTVRRVLVEGAPNMNLELSVDVMPVADLGGVSGGILTVAMSAVRAIPDVLAAPPGIVLPRPFAAYRFPQASRPG